MYLKKVVIGLMSVLSVSLANAEDGWSMVAETHSFNEPMKKPILEDVRPKLVNIVNKEVINLPNWSNPLRQSNYVKQSLYEGKSAICYMIRESVITPDVNLDTLMRFGYLVFVESQSKVRYIIIQLMDKNTDREDNYLNKDVFTYTYEDKFGDWYVSNMFLGFRKNMDYTIRGSYFLDQKKYMCIKGIHAVRAYMHNTDRDYTPENFVIGKYKISNPIFVEEPEDLFK